MKTTTHTLLSAAQSTGLRALSLCHWVVNVAAAVQRSVRQGYRGSAAAMSRDQSHIAGFGGNRDRRRTAPPSRYRLKGDKLRQACSRRRPATLLLGQYRPFQAYTQRGLANSLDAELGGGVLPHHSGIRGSGTLALRNRASASQALVAINRSAGVVTPMTPSTVIVARWRL
jgi:hypothetical protein